MEYTHTQLLAHVLTYETHTHTRTHTHTHTHARAGAHIYICHPTGKRGLQRVEYTHAQLLAHVLTCEIHNPVPWHESSMSFVSWSEPSALTHELLVFMRKSVHVWLHIYVDMRHHTHTLLRLHSRHMLHISDICGA